MINFNIETPNFKLENRLRKKKLIKSIIEENGRKTGEVNYIFLNDEDLLKMNIEYLNHHTYTDIITFDNSEDSKVLDADIFISTERVKENSNEFKTNFDEELVRVMSHGVLHILGFNDHTDDEIRKMRLAEEKALEAYRSL